jgi:hypothetical protein
MFKDEYLNTIRNSFVPKLISFNQNYSYLVKNKLELNTQIPYVVQVYQEMLLGMIQKIYEIAEEIKVDEQTKQTVYIKTVSINSTKEEGEKRCIRIFNES